MSDPLEGLFKEIEDILDPPRGGMDVALQLLNDTVEGLGDGSFNKDKVEAVSSMAIGYALTDIARYLRILAGLQVAAYREDEAK